MSTTTLAAAAALDPGLKADIEQGLGYTAAIVGVCCLAKLIFVGARLAWDRKHTPGVESPTAAEGLAAVVGWILAGGTSVAIATALLVDTAVPGTTGPSPANPNDKTLVEQLEQVRPPQDGQK
jgi:hypothetical protein